MLKDDRVSGHDPEDEHEGVRPGRIAWFSIFASGLVVGLILGLGLTPQGIAGAARQIGQVSSLWAAPTDRPMAAAPTVDPTLQDADKTAEPTPPLAGAPASDKPAKADALATADLAPPAAVSPSASLSPAVVSTPVQPVLAPPPAAVSEATSFAPVSAGERRLTLGVFGDSLADGLWAGLYRDMRAGGRFDVVKFSQPATGLSRYDYVNVQQKTVGQLAAHHVDVAVVMFGTNDQQAIVENGRILPFASPEWRTAYGARMDALVGLLRRQGAVVYWVGLPKMRAEGFDQKAQLINAVAQQRMAALGVRYIPTNGATEDASGAYAAYLPFGEAGRMTLMRANDGIHMSMPGYLKIAGPVAASIRADLKAPTMVSAAEGLR